MSEGEELIIRKDPTSSYTAVYGSKINHLAAEIARDHPGIDLSSARHAPHITLQTADEPCINFPLTVLDDLHFLGVGKSGCHFHIVVLMPAANAVRKRYGLNVKDFHVTLTGSGGGNLDRSVSSLVQPLDEPMELLTDVQLEALSKHSILVDDVDLARSAIYALFSRLAIGPHNHSDPAEAELESRAMLLLANVGLQTGAHRLSMLAFAQAFDACDGSARTGSILRGLLVCASHTELGPFTLAEEQVELDGLSPAVSSRLFRPWSLALRENLQQRAEQLAREAGWSTEGRWQCTRGKRLLVRLAEGEHALPRFFVSALTLCRRRHDSCRKAPFGQSWVVPFRLAGSSTPRCATDIHAFEQVGITHILTLTAEEPLPADWFGASSVGHTYLPIRDGAAPTVAEHRIFVHLALRVMKSGGALLVHCGGGKGRAGSLLAGWVAAYGLAMATDKWSFPQLGASQAMEAIRTLRPGSIETLAQESGIKTLVNALYTDSPLGRAVEEPADTEPRFDMTDDGAATRALQSIDLLILVGLPGSGKSWLRDMLKVRDANRWTSVSGDDDGGRRAVEAALSHRAKSASSQEPALIVDQCNITKVARREALRLASGARKPYAVYFDYEEQLCSFRASMRPSHPNVSPAAASRVVAQFAKTLEPPTCAEGFAGVITVSSFAAAKRLSEMLAPVLILKFPRTPHLLNLGSVTEDDIVSERFAGVSLGQERSDNERASSRGQENAITSSTKQSDEMTFVITEKIDGANVGFSLSSSLSVQVQNRGHWVSSDPQFRKMENWILSHGQSLYGVLNRDNEEFTERWVLFGEWMAAVHSIHYTSLPGLFIAYDLYDRSLHKFVARSRLEALLGSTTIPLVPVLHRLKELPSDAELARMVQGRSAFTDGQLEGVYIKLEGSGYVKARGKVVRPGFICGNEHWSKGIRIWNSLASDAAVQK